MVKAFKYVYGPVPSRRLGQSLGLDLVPFKTCTYDCIYCQLGRTTHRTLERRVYVPAKDILVELEQALGACRTRPDYISLAGSGEPTLNSDIAVLIREIKRLSTIPLAVLTNGALLWMPEVHEALMPADLVLPSLDAGDARRYRRINRPCPGIAFSRMVEGLIRFTQAFQGQTWLEIVLLEGLNDTPDALRAFAELVTRIGPERVQLNTVCRPPAEPYALGLSLEKMRAIQSFFSLPADIIGERVSAPAGDGAPAIPAGPEIMALLGRRPCTAEDVSVALGMHVNEVLKYLDRLVAEGKLRVSLEKRKAFYTVCRPTPSSRGKGGWG